MLYPIFREPGYKNTSNPYVGRILDGTQDLVQELEELCGTHDTVISAGGTLVQPLMYRRALSYGNEHVGTVRDIAQWLRASSMLGGVIGFSFDTLEVKRQRGNELFSVRARLGSNAVRQQLVDECRFVQQELPLYALRTSIVTGMVRVAETPSLAFANTVADRILASEYMRGELHEPQMLFTPPYGASS